MAFRTEFELTLPKGYVDENGTLHKEVTMRLSVGADEIHPLKDPRVIKNPAYLTLILFSRVVTRLGTLDNITPHIMENMFTEDLAFLQHKYNEINGVGTGAKTVICPNCSHEFHLEENESGGS